jgi:site-specific DNA-methyltransferase (adenine-specific)
MSKRYSIIYTDCPWSYQNWTHKKNGAAIAHYQPMSAKDLAQLPVNEISEDNSLCFMWATFPKLKEAIFVLEAWNFDYITTPFVWNKIYSNKRPYCGLGFWTRSGAEIVLLGKKGKGIKRLNNNVKQVITAEVKRPHSSKPTIVRDRIVELVGDFPRIELFGRPPIPKGWDMIGYEVDGLDIHDSLQKIIGGNNGSS